MGNNLTLLSINWNDSTDLLQFFFFYYLVVFWFYANHFSTIFFVSVFLILQSVADEM